MNQATTSRMPTSLDDVLALMQADRKAVDDLIMRRLASDVFLVNQISHHIIHGGGKRMRPLVHLLSARAAGYRGVDHHKLAAIIEFIHTSTLLHDDVVNKPTRRCGQVAAQKVEGKGDTDMV